MRTGRTRWSFLATTSGGDPLATGSRTILTSDHSGAILIDHYRLQTGYELESETTVTGAFEHEFAKADHTVRLEGQRGRTPQQEVAHFVEHVAHSPSA